MLFINILTNDSDQTTIRVLSSGEPVTKNITTLAFEKKNFRYKCTEEKKNQCDEILKFEI